MKIDIDINKLEPIKVGRTTPYRWENKVIKFKILPEWDFFESARECRDHYSIPIVDVNTEVIATNLAIKLGVHTPEMFLVDVDLIKGKSKFSTQASIRPWIEGDTYLSIEQLSIACPKVCHRLDWMYIILIDYLIGNWNRTTQNLILCSLPQKTLIPIDYESCFDYEKVPTTEEGVKLVFDEFLFAPNYTGITTIPIQIFEQVWKYIKKNATPETLSLVDKRLVTRLENMEKSLQEFIIKYKIGCDWVYNVG